MSCNPSDLQELSKKLSQNKDEVSIRACISRAYYSAYHFSLQYAFNEQNKSGDWIAGEGGVHQKLISYMEKSSKIEEKAAGYILRDLRAKRVIADYHLDDNLQKEDAVTALAILDRLIEKLGLKK